MDLFTCIKRIEAKLDLLIKQHQGGQNTELRYGDFLQALIDGDRNKAVRIAGVDVDEFFDRMWKTVHAAMSRKPITSAAEPKKTAPVNNPAFPSPEESEASLAAAAEKIADMLVETPADVPFDFGLAARLMARGNLFSRIAWNMQRIVSMDPDIGFVEKTWNKPGYVPAKIAPQDVEADDWYMVNDLVARHEDMRCKWLLKKASGLNPLASVWPLR